jgi:hypothetical protein
MMKRLVFLFGLSLAVASADATISTIGDVTYTIDGTDSKSSLLESGQTVAYKSGTGKLIVKENDGKMEKILSKPTHTPYTATRKQSMFAGIDTYFSKTDTRYSTNSTRGLGNCKAIGHKGIEISPEVSFIEYERDDKVAAVYAIDDNGEKILQEGSDIASAKSGDKLILKDKDGAFVSSYCVK